MKKVIVLSILLTLFSAVTAIAGNSSGGGGNALDGKEIESYEKPVNDIAGYSEVVEPAFVALYKLLPQYSQNLRTEPLSFYLVPSQLRELGEDVTGLPFPSDQVAIQKNREVWIDSDLFDTMGTPQTRKVEEGRLLLHEIVLADLLRIYQVSVVNQVIEARARTITSLIMHAGAYESKDLSQQLQAIIEPAGESAYDPIGFLGTAEDKRAIYLAIQDVIQGHGSFCTAVQPFMKIVMTAVGMPEPTLKGNLSGRDLQTVVGYFNTFATAYDREIGQLSLATRTAIENNLFLLNPVDSNRVGLVAPINLSEMSSELVNGELEQVSCADISGVNSPYYASFMQNVYFPQSK